MSDFRRAERLHPELRELQPFSHAWYWLRACAVVLTNPAADRQTCDNLWQDVRKTA